MATADAIYVDPSALVKLYLNETHSRAVSSWRARLRGPLTVTHHGRLELANGIGLAAYRGVITAAVYETAIAALDADFAEGRYVQADILWRAALRRATELSRQFARTLGCRSLDVLHVASALELGMQSFMTFDERQKQLARAVDLKLLAPS